MLNQKGIDGVYGTLFVVGLILGLAVAYLCLRFIPSFANLLGIS